MNYSEMQLDALAELSNIGSGTAATALSSLLGRPIDLHVTTASAVPFAEALEGVGPADKPSTGVALPVVGDVEATVLLLFSPDHAAKLCSLLAVEAGTEVGVSALGEIANILGASYIGALGQMTGLVLEPRPPRLATDTLGAIVASLPRFRAPESELALVLDAELVVEDADCAFAFMMVPTLDAVGLLLARLGLG